MAAPRPTPLSRYPFALDPTDLDAVRAWVLERAHRDVVTRGVPHPELLLIAQEHVDHLDLSLMSQRAPQADVAATFRQLAAQPEVVRTFFVLPAEGHTPEGEPVTMALVLEQLGPPLRPVPSWWNAVLRYERDAATGLGQPIGDWHRSRETADPDLLPPFVRALVEPAPGAVAAPILAARAPLTDLMVHRVRIEQSVDGARDMHDLARQMTIPGYTSGERTGASVVVLLGDEVLVVPMPEWVRDHQSEVLRHFANAAWGRADGAALVAVATLPEAQPPEPFLQVVAEHGSEVCESRTPLTFPGGPSAPPVLADEGRMRMSPVPPGGLWLGVDPSASFVFGEAPMPEA